MNTSQKRIDALELVAIVAAELLRPKWARSTRSTYSAEGQLRQALQLLDEVGGAMTPEALLERTQESAAKAAPMEAASQLPRRFNDPDRHHPLSSIPGDQAGRAVPQRPDGFETIALAVDSSSEPVAWAVEQRDESGAWLIGAWTYKAEAESVVRVIGEYRVVVPLYRAPGSRPAVDAREVEQQRAALAWMRRQASEYAPDLEADAGALTCSRILAAALQKAQTKEGA